MLTTWLALHYKGAPINMQVAGVRLMGMTRLGVAASWACRLEP